LAAAADLGVANYIKAVRPEIKVIGVQMNDSDAMMQSVSASQKARDTDRCGPVLRRHRRQAGGRRNLPHGQRPGG
jgi:cysteine synthase